MSTTTDFGAMEMFGLSSRQLRILFSIEKLLTERDILASKGNSDAKTGWLKNWSETIANTIVQNEQSLSDGESFYYDKKTLKEVITQELLDDPNHTWYYIIMLEATLFTPYTALSKSTAQDKAYSKLKYSGQLEALKVLVRANDAMEDIYIDRFFKTYTQEISKLENKATKIALGVVSVVAVAGVTAATAGAFAGPLAVLLFGSHFTLTGAALTSASLAFAGGGAIAIGGAGVAGGTMAIVGGGALLGFATGGAAAGATSMLVASAPHLALTQAAKLEVVLKEIVINAQNDVATAQKVLENYKNQIVFLHGELSKQRLQLENDKKTIGNMKKSLEYMEKSYQSTQRFLSSYEIGVATEK